jgi:hypothetical protein
MHKKQRRMVENGAPFFHLFPKEGCSRAISHVDVDSPAHRPSQSRHLCLRAIPKLRADL